MGKHLFFSAAFILMLILIFINASSDTDRPVLAEPLDIDKQSLFIENIRKVSIPENKITVVKLMENRKEYKSYLVSYPVNKMTLFAMMSIPSSKKPADGFPVVVVNHGYIPPEQYSTLNSYKHVTGYYASNGFLTLKPDYRGFGNSIKEDDRSFFGRIDYVYDVLYLMNAVSSIPDADKVNIFMYGHSMGGDVTLRVLEMTGRVKAATLWAPVSAMFPESVLHYTRKRNTGQTADSIQKILDGYFTKADYEKMSGLSNTQFISAPLILHHGTMDDSVPYQWSMELMKMFDQNKINYKFYSYPGEDHNFAKGSFYKVLKKDVDFFRSFLKKG